LTGRAAALDDGTVMTGDVAAAPHVLPGTILAGKYRVDHLLGRGGMGVVVAAHHLQLDEKVAIKFLLPEALHDEEADGRFLREAQAAVKIKSEHVARVTDVGRLDDGLPYMVMEYLDGTDLARWIAELGFLPVEQAVDFLLQACEAVAEAHTLGIVHRDLKPANLFCIRRRDGALAIKVLDFGISKVTTPGVSGHDVTRAATVIGSPAYISPEQMRASKEVDTRADIWSLGVILFELLCARTPFESTSLPDLAIKVATEPATPLRTYRPDVPAGIELVIERCLQKDRAHRYAHVAELAAALESFGSRSAATSAERIRGTQRMSAPSLPQLVAADASVPRGPTTLGTWDKTSSVTAPGGVRVAAVVAIGVVVLLLVAAASALLVHGRHADTSGPVAASSDPAAVSAPAAAPAPATNELAVVPPLASAGASSVPSASATPPADPSTRTGDHPRGTADHPRGPGCSPPYTVDDLGRKHFKPQCFGAH
jgi:serine/threonine protein kinase